MYDGTTAASVTAGIDAAMSAFGAIHVNCNFAGIGNAMRTMGKNGPFPLDAFKMVVDVNVVGTFNTTTNDVKIYLNGEDDGGDTLDGGVCWGDDTHGEASPPATQPSFPSASTSFSR